MRPYLWKGICQDMNKSILLEMSKIAVDLNLILASNLFTPRKNCGKIYSMSMEKIFTNVE